MNRAVETLPFLNSSLRLFDVACILLFYVTILSLTVILLALSTNVFPEVYQPRYQMTKGFHDDIKVRR